MIAEYNEIYTNPFLNVECPCGYTRQIEIHFNHNSIGYCTLNHNLYNEIESISFTPYPWCREYEEDEGQIVKILILMFTENGNLHEVMRKIEAERDGIGLSDRGWD